MAKILSQDEVDALMGAMERGDLAGDEEADKNTATKETVLGYNFRRPNLITKDQLRGFTNLHEDFARELQANLAILLRTNVEVSMVSAEQQLYSEFVFSLSEITHAILFTVDPLPGTAVLEINLSLVFGFVDLLVGGKGDVETAMRKLTEVEVAILEPLTAMVFNRLTQAWHNAIPVTIKTARHESSPEYIQAAPADAAVVVLTFDAKIGLANGIINLCYPLPMVQGLLKELHGKNGQMDNYYGKYRPDDFRRLLLAALMEVPVRTSVTLGHAVVRVDDWLHLENGDVLILNQRTADMMRVDIEKEPLFQGVAGRRNQHLAVKLCRWMELPRQPPVDGLLGRSTPEG